MSARSIVMNIGAPMRCCLRGTGMSTMPVSCSSTRRIVAVSGSAHTRPRARPGNSMLTHSSVHSVLGSPGFERPVVHHHRVTAIHAPDAGARERELVPAVGQEKRQRLGRHTPRDPCTRACRPVFGGLPFTVSSCRVTVAGDSSPVDGGIPLDAQLVDQPPGEAVERQVAAEPLDGHRFVGDDALRAWRSTARRSRSGG